MTIVDSCVLPGFDIDITSNGTGCSSDPMVVIHTYNITDGEENWQCVRSHTVADVVLPELVCPNNVTVACGSNLDPLNTGMAFGSDNCLIQSVSFSDGAIAAPCPYTMERTWTATDVCGNQMVCVQFITLHDNEPPVLSGTDEIIILDCNEYIVPDTPFATDNCDIVVDLSMDMESQVGSCPNNWTETFTWTATDDCGNASQRVVSVQYEDTTEPFLYGVPADGLIECGDDPPDAVVFAVDNCSSFVNVSLTAQSTPLDCGYQLVRTWNSEDVCGNSVSETQTLIVEDTTPPEINNPPGNIEVDCGESFPEIPYVEVTDNCDPFPQVDFQEVVTGDNHFDTGAEQNCELMTPASPFLTTDRAMNLYQFPEGYEKYIAVDSYWHTYPGGIGHITATLQSIDNPNGGWIADISLMDGMTWNEWSNQEYPTGYRDDFGLAGNNYLDWLYFLIDDGEATLTGYGDFDGSFLFLTHSPTSGFYGFQVGVASNGLNDQAGMGGLMHFQGSFMDSLTGYNDFVAGTGELAFDSECCVHPTVTWTWTATDCAGFETQHSLQINYSGSGTSCSGDLNGDGVINTSDILGFLSEFGCEIDCNAADLSGDGEVNTTDLLALLSLFGSNCP
jgi:hypothetical protein